MSAAAVLFVGVMVLVVAPAVAVFCAWLAGALHDRQVAKREEAG